MTATPSEQRSPRRLQPALIDELRLERDLVLRANARLNAPDTVLLAVSGKQGAGKDTVAPCVLGRHNIRSIRHVYFADSLKAEADDVIRLVRAANNAQQATETLAERQRVTEHDAAGIVELLFDSVRADPTLHARCRTAEIRSLLQRWGTDVRRRQDGDYWARITMREVVDHIADGWSLYLSDMRFPNEADMSLQAIVFCVRLNVSRATQIERLTRRDGRPPSPESFDHESETALDNYDRFDLTLDNDGELEDAVSAITAAMRRN